MSELKITGSPTPTVGKAEFYSVNQLLSNAIPTKIFDGSKPNAFEYPVEWSVHILENGRWVQKEENDKTGNKVSYTFIQKSLERKGIRILAKRGNQVARLGIKPHKAEGPKIDSIEFLDKNGNKPTKPFSYGQTLKARVHCLHMENRRIYATLWEDDAEGSGHDKANEKNKMKALPGIVKGGIVDIDFVLEPDFAKIANAIKAKGDSDEGKTHEYYVTAEILNKKTASKNTNVANPSYKDTTTTKPAAPKKETPAQKKGQSKKQEKEKSVEAGIIDWLEGIFKVNPIIAPNPEAPTGNNPLKTGEPDKNPKEEKEENNGVCVCKDYDLIWGNKVNCDFRKKVIQICKSLWPDKYKEMANGLMAVMKVETSSSFKANQIMGKELQDINTLSKDDFFLYKKDGTKTSRAVGLIQFTQAALVQIGEFTNGSGFDKLHEVKLKFAKMGEIKQLDYVKKYFEAAKDKIKSPEDIYLHVFAPSGVGKKDNFVLYEKGTDEYSQNKSVDEENNNDGEIQRSEILGRYKTSFDEGKNNRVNKFICGEISNTNVTAINAKGIVTYHVYSDGKIEKHIPKIIKDEYKKQYKYVYHDSNSVIHEVCVAEWHETNEKASGTKPTSMPTHSIIISDQQVSEGQTTRRVKYENGDIAEYGSNAGSTFWVLYKATGKKIELVRMPDSLNISEPNAIIKYTFSGTQRRYTGRDYLAVFIGVLAECGFNDVVTTGSCFKEASCFPSVAHVNGKSIDTMYLTHDKEQKLINAFNKFGMIQQLVGVGMSFNHASDGGTLHNTHLHSGGISADKVAIIEEK
jgi:predicted Fe-Mo cluster-binding NifX family protein